MNERLENEQGSDPNPINLDRLVDGELPEPQRREILLALEHQPGGWRQCAMAFLEAQAWGQALTQLARKPESLPGATQSEPEFATGAAAQAVSMSTPVLQPSPVAVDARPAPLRQTTTREKRWTWWLAVASSFLITLSMGMYVQKLWHVFRGIPPMEQVAALSVPTNTVSVGRPAPQPQQQQIEVPVWSTPIVRIPALTSPQQTLGLLRELQLEMGQNGVETFLCEMSLPNGQQVVLPIQQAMVIYAQASQH